MSETSPNAGLPRILIHETADVLLKGLRVNEFIDSLAHAPHGLIAADDRVLCARVAAVSRTEPESAPPATGQQHHPSLTAAMRAFPQLARSRNASSIPAASRSDPGIRCPYRSNVTLIDAAAHVAGQRLRVHPRRDHEARVGVAGLVEPQPPPPVPRFVGATVEASPAWKGLPSIPKTSSSAASSPTASRWSRIRSRSTPGIGTVRVSRISCSRDFKAPPVILIHSAGRSGGSRSASADSTRT